MFSITAAYELVNFLNCWGNSGSAVTQMEVAEQQQMDAVFEWRKQSIIGSYEENMLLLLCQWKIK